MSFSPDGRRIVFAAHGPAGDAAHSSWNVYEYDFDTRRVRRVIAYSSSPGSRTFGGPDYVREANSTQVAVEDSVMVGGGSIDTEDAGVLITGSANLGASVAAIVADGQGKQKCTRTEGHQDGYGQFSGRKVQSAQ